MNINQWIDDLDQANPPRELPAFISQSRATRKHGRGSGKSSLLEPFVDRIRHTRQTQPAESPCASSSATSSATHTSMSSSSSTPSSSSSNKYQRRPRHRTKADKYHPETKQRSQSREKKKKKNKKREKKVKRSHRKKHKSEAIIGVVQSFHAKNVRKNRLTLNPGSKVGLYTKGRSSGPIRGKGLPDLVFSEMRFLQKPEPVGKEKLECTSKKKHKKRRELSEEEISRYFDASKTRPENNNRGRERHPTPLEAPAAVQRKHAASPVVLNLPKKPFLGFGSRGTHPPTTSYYSWSDSGRASSSLAKQVLPTLEPLAVGQLQSSRIQDQTQAVSVEKDATQYLPARQTADRRHGGSHDRSPEPSPDTNRTIIRPARYQLRFGNDGRAVSETVFNNNKCKMPMPTAEPLANHSVANANSIDKASSMGTVSTNLGCNDGFEGPTSAHSKVLNKAGAKQYLEPLEELLQDCEVAARAPIPVYYDNSLPQHIRHVSHEYANLQLWRPGEGNLSEYDYQDDMVFVDELVYPDQPEVVDYGERESQSYGDTIDDDDSESLLAESQHDYGLPTEDEADWEEGDASRHDAVQHYENQDADTVDEFATFWQPNRLY